MKKHRKSVHCHRLLAQEYAVAPVAEAFPFAPLPRVTRKNGAKFRFDVGLFHHVLEEFVEPCTGWVATEPELVAPGCLANKSNLGHIRARTAVRTASRAD